MQNLLEKINQLNLADLKYPCPNIDHLMQIAQEFGGYRKSAVDNLPEGERISGLVDKIKKDQVEITFLQIAKLKKMNQLLDLHNQDEFGYVIGKCKDALMVTKLQAMVGEIENKEDAVDKLMKLYESEEMGKLMAKTASLEFIGKCCVKKDQAQYMDQINQIEKSLRNVKTVNDIKSINEKIELNKYSFLLDNRKILEDLLAKISVIRLAGEKLPQADKNSMLQIADNFQKEVVDFFLAGKRDLNDLKSKCEHIIQGLVNLDDHNHSLNKATTDAYAAIKNFFLFLASLTIVGAIIRVAVKDRGESFFFEKAAHLKTTSDFQASLNKLTQESFEPTIGEIISLIDKIEIPEPIDKNTITSVIEKSIEILQSRVLIYYGKLEKQIKTADSDKLARLLLEDFNRLALEASENFQNQQLSTKIDQISQIFEILKPAGTKRSNEDAKFSQSLVELWSAANTEEQKLSKTVNSSMK